jgi:hypothetical protein
VKDSLAKDSVAKAAKLKASTIPKLRPESIAVQCARLLERVSLGEKLSDSERVLLRQRCPK